MQSSTIKTAINIMIYGVTIFLNDVRPLKNGGYDTKTRLNEQGLFTSKKTATSFYLQHLKRWNNERQVSYGRADVRGLATMYKATVLDGRIYFQGTIIYKETT